MIAITRHPDCLHLCFIDDQEAPLRDTKKFVDLNTLNMLWTGEVDVLLVEPVLAHQCMRPRRDSLGAAASGLTS